MKIYEDHIRTKMKKEVETKSPFTDDEIIYLYALTKTLAYYNKRISLKAYQDNSTCLIKKKGLWEIYQIEDTYRLNRFIYSEITEACNHILSLLKDKNSFGIMQLYLSNNFSQKEIIAFASKYNITRENPLQRIKRK